MKDEFIGMVSIVVKEADEAVTVYVNPVKLLLHIALMKLFNWY